MYHEDIIMTDKLQRGNRCFKCPQKNTCGNPFNSFLRPHKPIVAVVLFEPDYNMPDIVLNG